jgi:hypothetical protein
VVTAANDLRDLRDELDGVLHGALWPDSLRCSTVVGREAQALTEQLRARLYRSWSENCALRARLARALAEVEGQRAMNAQLTEEAMAREAAPRGRGVEALFGFIEVPRTQRLTAHRFQVGPAQRPTMVRTEGELWAKYEPTEETDEP